MDKFTKADLVARLASSKDVASAAAASRIIELMIKTIKEQVSAGKQVNISGLCLFKPAIQSPRSGVNHLTGKPFNTPSKKVVKIKPAATFKAQVAK